MGALVLAAALLLLSISTFAEETSTAYLPGTAGIEARFDQLKALYSNLGVKIHDELVPKPWVDGIGLFANASIPENATLLISIPDKVFITPRRILKLHPDWKGLPRYLRSEHALIAAFIARVRAGVDTSDNDKKGVFNKAEYLYIRYLPDKCVNGYTLSSKAMELLPKKAKDMIGLERATLDQDYVSISRALPRGSEPSHGFNAKQFAQAMCLVSSRVYFSYELDSYAMTPFVDMLNHGSSSKNNSAIYAQGNPFGLVVSNNIPLSKGEQVMIYYGDLPANQQFFRYGFVDDLPQGTKFLRDVEMLLPMINKERDPNEAIKVSIIRKLRTKGNRLNAYVAIDRRLNQGIFGEDLAILRLIFIPPYQFSALGVGKVLSNTRSCFPRHLSNFTYTIESEYFFRKELIDLCRALYVHVPSTDYDALEKAAGGDMELFKEVRAAASLSRVHNRALLNCMDYTIPIESPAEKAEREAREAQLAEQYKEDGDN